MTFTRFALRVTTAAVALASCASQASADATAGAFFDIVSDSGHITLDHPGAISLSGVAAGNGGIRLTFSLSSSASAGHYDDEEGNVHTFSGDAAVMASYSISFDRPVGSFSSGTVQQNSIHADVYNPDNSVAPVDLFEDNHNLHFVSTLDGVRAYAGAAADAHSEIENQRTPLDNVTNFVEHGSGYARATATLVSLDYALNTTASASGGSQITANLVPPTGTHFSVTATITAVAIGSVQAVPILPTTVQDSAFVFENAPSGDWIDPPATNGFQFATDGASSVTKILSLPLNIDPDNTYTVVVAGQSLGNFAAGASVDFVKLLGHAVSDFAVLGIDPVVDAGNPRAFPIQLAYDTDSANLTMTPSDAFTPGDANLDHHVNFADLVLLAQNYNRSGKLWNNGDFNFDSSVNFADLVALAQHYNTSTATLSLAGLDPAFAAVWALAQSLVPEPTVLVAMAAAAPLFLTRRPRRLRAAAR